MKAHVFGLETSPNTTFPTELRHLKWSCLREGQLARNLYYTFAVGEGSSGASNVLYLQSAPQDDGVTGCLTSTCTSEYIPDYKSFRVGSSGG